MAKFKKNYTKTKALARANALVDGRQGNAAYSSGARTAQSHGYKGGVGKYGAPISEKEGMINAWNNNETIRTYTSTKDGRMSVDGKRAGGATWTFTDKENGRQSGRSKLASRRQRYYDIRVGLGLAGG